MVRENAARIVPGGEGREIPAGAARITRCQLFTRTCWLRSLGNRDCGSGLAFFLDAGPQLLDGRVDVGDRIGLVTMEISGRIARKHLLRLF